jgi:hypothetical protein
MANLSLLTLYTRAIKLIDALLIIERIESFRRCLGGAEKEE